MRLATPLSCSWYKNPLLPFWPKELQSTIEALGKINGTYLPGEYVDNGKDYLAWKFDGNFGSTLAPTVASAAR